MERMNGEIRDGVKVIRGIKKMDSAWTLYLSCVLICVI